MIELNTDYMTDMDIERALGNRRDVYCLDGSLAHIRMSLCGSRVITFYEESRPHSFSREIGSVRFSAYDHKGK